MANKKIKKLTQLEYEEFICRLGGNKEDVENLMQKD